ncbi:uncharacterized protein [Rutidosis leptorrhynchoides]|uniref:uncharacterized protein n=1 Tax=Rutidosis leptorrhynchoides TaxID=125765 RepID=UPI003A991DE9
MSSSGGDSRVSIPDTVRNLIPRVKKTLGSLKYTDDFIYETLVDCDLNVKETSRRLNMIHDIKEIAGKHSIEDVYTMLKECNIDPNEAAQRLLYIDTFHEVKKKQGRRKSINNDTSEDFKRAGRNQLWGARGGRGPFYPSKASDDGGVGRNLSSGKEYGVSSRLEKGSRVVIPAHSVKENNVELVAKSAANSNGTAAVSNGTTTLSNGVSYRHKLVPKPSADVSSQNIRHICPVGTINCEIVKRSKSESKVNAESAESAVTIKVNAESADSCKLKQLNSDVVVKNQATESSQPPLLSTQNSSHVVGPVKANQPVKLPNEPLKVPKEESELKISAEKPDVMLEKLTISSHQPVIFPDHLHVPENFKSQFTFGSLDAILGDPQPSLVTESIQQNGEVVSEPSLSNQIVPTTAQEGEDQDHSMQDVSKHVVPSQDIISSDPALTHEHQTNMETAHPDASSQNAVPQNTRDYSYGFMPYLMGPHFVQQLDAPELQNGSSPVASTLGPTSVTTTAVTSQSSIALSPPVFPYFRQPYPGYIPYNPYFPPMYLPPNLHLLNPSVFPQQPPTGNVTTNVQGSNNEDVNAPQAKDSNIQPSVQQGEDPQVWAPVAGRDVPNVLPNYFYNFPHGQHMAFSPGLYYSSQTMTATVQPLLYPAHSSFGPVETMVQPPASYQQPQQTPQTELPDRETS